MARAEDKWTKEDLEERIKALFLQQALEHLNHALEMRRQEGRPVARLPDLVGSGDLLQLPEEPFGGHFMLSGGRVVSTDNGKLLHVFIGPHSPPTEPYLD